MTKTITIVVNMTRNDDANANPAPGPMYACAGDASPDMATRTTRAANNALSREFLEESSRFKPGSMSFPRLQSRPRLATLKYTNRRAKAQSRLPRGVPGHPQIDGYRMVPLERNEGHDGHSALVSKDPYSSGVYTATTTGSQRSSISELFGRG